MAQKYVDDLSKNVKRGLKTKIENGWYPALAPVGYLNNTIKVTGENNLIKDPERFALVPPHVGLDAGRLPFPGANSGHREQSMEISHQTKPQAGRREGLGAKRTI